MILAFFAGLLDLALAWWLIPFFFLFCVGAISAGEDLSVDDGPWWAFLLAVTWFAFAGFTPIMEFSTLTSIGLYILSFLVIGTLWSVWKFILFMRRVGAEISNGLPAAKKYIDSQPMRDRSTEVYHVAVGQKLLQNNSFLVHLFEGDSWNFIKEDGSISFNVKAKRIKGRIFGWILFWPFSMINYIFGSLVRDLIDGIINAMHNIYIGIAKAALPNVKGVLDEGKQQPQSLTK